MGAVDLGLIDALRRGLSAFCVPEPVTLEEWAREHFYLSAESSYVEQRWSPWWFQCAIMACVSNDDISEVIWRKPARVGATKIILASILYNAQHKRPIKRSGSRQTTTATSSSRPNWSPRCATCR